MGELLEQMGRRIAARRKEKGMTQGRIIRNSWGIGTDNLHC